MLIKRLINGIHTSPIVTFFYKGLGTTVGIGAGITVAETSYAFFKTPIEKMKQAADSAGNYIFDSKKNTEPSKNKR
jgi:hypothetical protein